MSWLRDVAVWEPVRALVGSQALVQLVVGLVLIGAGERALGVAVLLAAAGVAAGGEVTRRAVWPAPAHREGLEQAYADGHRDGAAAATGAGGGG